MSSRCISRFAVGAAVLWLLIPWATAIPRSQESPGGRDSGGIIIGRVSDAGTGEPLTSANLYLSFTTIGGSTDASGRVILTRLPPGSYDVVVSLVGFEMHGQRITVTPRDTVVLDVRLTPKLIETGPVDITATPDAAWIRSLEHFTRVCIGTSDFAGKCTILNPETIEFTTMGDTLIAMDAHPLIIENRALGYRVHVVLAEFTWNLARDAGQFLIYPYFEELTDSGTGVREQWAENREKAFNGSIRHFFRSLIRAETHAEAFTMYSGSIAKLTSGQGHRVVDEDFGINRDSLRGYVEISFPGDVMVEYGDRDTDPFRTTDPRNPRRQTTARGVPPLKVSIVRMTGTSVVLDTSGNLFDPLSIEVAGDWALRRIESLLPGN